ncbi:MAG: hypothetical protein ACM31D_17535 [Bacteroidota bacterium]
MTRSERKRLKWMVSGGGMLWMLLVGWLMWVTLPEDAVTTHSSDQLKDRMSLCNGSFRDRYDCKEQLIIESGREAFYILSLRFLLVIVPPMVGTFWLSSYLARHPIALMEEEHHVASDGDWKARAQRHTEMQSPEEAAEDLHLSADELPSHPLHSHHRIDDIAPVDDWKARAQLNIRGPRRNG